MNHKDFNEILELPMDVTTDGDWSLDLDDVALFSEDGLGFDAELLDLKAYQYDLVCNGFEIASGGIRNHKPETMVKEPAKAFRSASKTQK